ncbi:MAG: hypothetical protein OXE94_02510 [Aestuariivita sp.]|nr:hypothetical protein [Aestuariivita sp.]MCY4203712.1 hypothetical protein [Aestuariivita sp.]
MTEFNFIVTNHPPPEIFERWTKRTGIVLAAALVATLMVAAFSTEARAQMPTVSIIVNGSSFESARGAPSVRLRSDSSIPANTAVRILVSVQSGYQYYFRNHGVLALLSGSSTLADFNGNVIQFQTTQAGQFVNIDREISFPNDRINSGAVGDSDTG